MISDRITLNLAYLYLYRIEQNEGKVSDILVSVTNEDNPIRKALKRFNTVADLKTYTDEVAPITNINKMSCMRMSIYELKSFNVTKVIGKRIGIIPIKNDVKVRKFKTKGEVTPISMSDINDGYYYNWNIVNDKFGGLKRDEYIKKQNTYIDCGYIDGDLTIDIKSLEDLYKKYKIV
jgi:hypothetical protein